MDGGKLAHRVHDYHDTGRVTFGRRRVTTVQQDGEWGGLTLYVGSRSSPKMLRVYDKHAESKGKHSASRFEFELKDVAAHEVTSILAQWGGYLKASTIWTGLMREFADWEELKEVSDLLWGEVTPVDAHRKERLQDKKEWLSNQVLPSFVRDAQNEGGELWRWFFELVEKARLGA
jgi:DNA relaxase NicK